MTGVHVDADGLIDHTARQAALASDAADCVAELRAGGFGAWWRDGRETGLDARLTDLADRLENAAGGVGDAAGRVRRNAAEMAAADTAVAHGLRSLP
ncbi:hypothetical protein L5G28_16000 [Gordonia sp. HY285]|uniref:hypothetical protein n=1 Tax=Gordonia liuliyuniae TaxID=2911517 RepID=UPI001F2D1305|nr:hypothetical protein [Gordonia liuliyuniae]MCF8611649.1 hypothetical protein [Gordonia liuliyuniae]